MRDLKSVISKYVREDPLEIVANLDRFKSTHRMSTRSTVAKRNINKDSIAYGVKMTPRVRAQSVFYQ